MSSFAQLCGRAIRLSDDALAQAVQEETVLLDLQSSQYFGLNEVGSRVWALLAEGHDLMAVRDRLLDEYDVTAAVLEPDLAALIDDLVDAGLVMILGQSIHHEDHEVREGS